MVNSTPPTPSPPPPVLLPVFDTLLELRAEEELLLLEPSSTTSFETELPTAVLSLPESGWSALRALVTLDNPSLEVDSRLLPPRVLVVSPKVSLRVEESLLPLSTPFVRSASYREVV